MAIVIRACREEDFPSLIAVWKAVGLTLGASDTPEELSRLLQRNPDTCLVLEEDGLIKGGVMGGFDGRRGLVHHLAVSSESQGRGYGRALMEVLDARYRQMGVVKYSFWIEADNANAVEFYLHLGYELRDLVTMSKTLIHE